MAVFHKARVSRVGDKLLCGRRVDCGGELAAIEAEGVVRTLPGWAPRPDGIWRLTNRARQRMKLGWSAALRRSHVAVASDRPDRVLEGVPPTNVIERTTLFICPKCGAPNVVRP